MSLFSSFGREPSARGALVVLIGLLPIIGCSSSFQASASNADAGSTGGASTGGKSGGNGGATTGGRSNGAGGVNAGGVTSGNGGLGAGGSGGVVSNAGGAGGTVVGNGGTVGTGGLGAGGQGGGIGTTRPCLNPKVIFVSNGPMFSTEDTGFDQCGTSWGARRRLAKVCPLGPTTTNLNQCSPSYCSSDADCKAGSFCSESRHLAGYCGCFPGCYQDSDCAPGNICFCGTPTGHCVPATCKDDSSCSSGSLCASYLAPCVSGTIPQGACTGATNGCFSGFACQSAADECMYDDDCLPDNARCELQNGRRVCAPACPGPPPPTP